MWIDRLAETLPRFPRAVPWQWIELDDYALTLEDVEQYAWVVSPRHHYGGHLAFSALLRMQPSFGLRFAGNLIATPPFSWAAALGYLVVSKNRHRLPGGTAACAAPSPGAVGAGAAPAGMSSTDGTSSTNGTPLR